MRRSVLAARHPTTAQVLVFFFYYLFFAGHSFSFYSAKTLSSKLLIDSGDTSQVKHRGVYRRSDERQSEWGPCAGVQSLCKCMGLQVPCHPSWVAWTYSTTWNMAVYTRDIIQVVRKERKKIRHMWLWQRMLWWLGRILCIGTALAP